MNILNIFITHHLHIDVLGIYIAYSQKNKDIKKGGGLIIL